jgi:hypothetical protein
LSAEEMAADGLTSGTIRGVSSYNEYDEVEEALK